MNLPTEIFGNVVVVHTPEEISEDHADQFQRLLTSQERVKVIVDLDGTESIDSAGLEALLDATPPGCGRLCAGACKKRTTRSPRHRLTACSMIGSRLMSLKPGATRRVAV